MIASIVLAALLCIIFYELFVKLGVLSGIQQIFSTPSEALKIIKATDLDDRDKELKIRNLSLSIFKVTGLFVVKIAVIMLACGAALLLFSLVSGTPYSYYLEILMGWQFILGMLILALIYAKARSHLVA